MENQTRLAKFVDTLTLLAALFLANLLLLKGLVKNLTLLLLSAIILSLILHYFISIPISKSTKKKELKKAEQQHLDYILETFKYLDNSSIHSIFLDAIKTKHKISNTLKQGFVFENNTNNKTYLTFDFYNNETGLPALQKELEKAKKYNANLLFLAPAFSSDAKTLASNNPSINLLDATKTYKLLKDLEALPPIKPKNKPKRKLKETLYLITSKHLAKGYFKTSVLLFILSLFTRLTNYYKFMALFTLLLTIICLIPKNEKIKKVA